MGCDIHSVTQTYDETTGQWESVDVPFIPNVRNYTLFSFLAGVRHRPGVEAIAEPRDFPPDFDGTDVGGCDVTGDWDYHSRSWLLLSEMLDFDYDRKLEAGEYKGRTYRDVLPAKYFESLALIKALGVHPNHVRVVFWFDN